MAKYDKVILKIDSYSLYKYADIFSMLTFQLSFIMDKIMVSGV